MTQKSKVRKVINIITSVILVLLIAIVVFVFIARISGESPSIFGYHVFRVTSSSMEPTLMVNDVILVKETPANEIKNGDIVTYLSEQGQLKGEMITHRVIEEPYNTNGEYYYQTQGDAKGATPDPIISYSQIEGKYVRTLPVIDKLYTFFLSPGGLIAFIGVIILLFGYEMISLIVTYRRIDEHDDDYYEPKAKKEAKKRKKPKKTHFK